MIKQTAEFTYEKIGYCPIKGIIKMEKRDRTFRECFIHI